MAILDISLPDTLMDWVDAQARTGHYADAGDYIRNLIRRDLATAAAIVEVQGLIDEGLASGVSARSMDEVLTAARQRAAATAGE